MTGLVPKRRQTITWTHADPIHWRIYAAQVHGRWVKALVSTWRRCNVYILLVTWICYLTGTTIDVSQGAIHYTSYIVLCTCCPGLIKYHEHMLHAMAGNGNAPETSGSFGILTFLAIRPMCSESISSVCCWCPVSARRHILFSIRKDFKYLRHSASWNHSKCKCTFALSFSSKQFNMF